MRDLDYVFAVARIRVKEKSLLSDADIRQMAEMKDNQEILNFLSERGWGSRDDADQSAEGMLDAEERKLPELMRELRVDPELFQILSYPRLYHNLKAGIKELCTSDAPAHLYYEMDGFGRDEISRILREKDYQALPPHMRDVAERAYKVMLQTRDGQKCDVMIDRACLDACEEAGRRSGNALMRSYQESTVAVTDIRIAVRAQKTGKSLKFLQDALAPCDLLNVDTLAAAASGDEKTLMEYLEGSGFRDAADALKQSPAAFEKWCDDQVIMAILPQKMNSVSAGPVIAYYLARENEIKMVRILLTAKANGFSQESIRERLRKMYG